MLLRSRVHGNPKQKPPDFTRAGDFANHIFPTRRKEFFTPFDAFQTLVMTRCFLVTMTVAIVDYSSDPLPWLEGQGVFGLVRVSGDAAGMVSYSSTWAVL